VVPGQAAGFHDYNRVAAGSRDVKSSTNAAPREIELSLAVVENVRYSTALDMSGSGVRTSEALANRGPDPEREPGHAGIRFGKGCGGVARNDCVIQTGFLTLVPRRPVRHLRRSTRDPKCRTIRLPVSLVAIHRYAPRPAAAGPSPCGAGVNRSSRPHATARTPVRPNAPLSRAGTTLRRA